MENSILLGADIGGSHITSALVHLAKKEIVEGTFKRTSINSSDTAENIIDAWADNILQSLANYSERAVICVAMPGPFDYERGISWMQGLTKYGKLYGLCVKELLLERLKSRVSDILFVNDASCFLQGEVDCGVAQGYSKVAGFTLGTGFGSAISENGVVSSAEYWQSPFLKGTCETYFSSRWFVSKYAQHYEEPVANVKEIVALPDVADPMLHVFDEFGLNLGLFLLNLLRERPFDAIVLGGNISNASMYYLPQVNAYLEAHGIVTPILVSTLGESAALVGAASYGRSKLLQGKGRDTGFRL